jgi:hypothetical protein
LRGAGAIRPVGRGTLLGALRPKLGFGYDRAEDMLGTVLRAVIAGRVKLPCGGRGTDRDMGDIEGIALGFPEIEGCENDLTLPCDGRGMLWLIAICGALRFAIVGPLMAWLNAAPPLVFRLRGGRGIKRPAGCGSDRALVDGPSGV